MNQEKSENRDVRRFGYIYLKHIENKENYVVHNQVVSTDILNELDEVISVIFNLKPIIFALDGVERNYQELLASIEDHQSLLNKLGTKNLNILPILDVMRGNLSAAQKITNFLSSASAFLMQTETQLRRIHGENSSQLKEWNETRKNLHASNFSYRFLYELRNYSQHYNLPFSKFTVKGTRESESTPMEFTTGIIISRDSLLSEGYNWKNLKEEIRQLLPEFDLLPFTAEYLHDLRQLCFKSIRIQDAQLDKCARYLTKLKIPAGTIPVLYVGESTSKDTPPPRVELIPIVEFKYLLQVYDRLLKACEAE